MQEPDNNSTAVAAGVAVPLAVILLACIAVLSIYALRRHRRKRKPKTSAHSGQTSSIDTSSHVSSDLRPYEGAKRADQEVTTVDVHRILRSADDHQPTRTTDASHIGVVGSGNASAPSDPPLTTPAASDPALDPAAAFVPADRGLPVGPTLNDPAKSVNFLPEPTLNAPNQAGTQFATKRGKPVPDVTDDPVATTLSDRRTVGVPATMGTAEAQAAPPETRVVPQTSATTNITIGGLTFATLATNLEVRCAVPACACGLLVAGALMIDLTRGIWHTYRRTTFMIR